MLHYPAAWLDWFRPRDALASAVSELLLVGFHGVSPRSLSARLLARQTRRGQVGSVFFVTQNVGTAEQIEGLMRLFRNQNNLPLLAIDHEGGIVQRLSEAHGFSRIPKAHQVASLMSPSEARTLYALAGRELAKFGFHINLGPVLDVHEPRNPAIGKPGRAYDTNPEKIAAYGQAFLEGFGSAGILCAAKHFPGHGRAVRDSHDFTADITATWTEKELEPYERLIAMPQPPDMIMMGHLRLDSVAPDGWPATISTPIVTGLLRRRLAYEGVIVTDDIDMGAVSQSMSRKEVFVQSLIAGNDLIMIKNLFGYDPLPPQHAVDWVREAVAQGRLKESQVLASAERVRALRRRAHQKTASDE